MIKHLQQPNEASCFITSIAMMWGKMDSEALLDVLLGLIGHDGTEVLWPDLAITGGSACYRGHSLDEIMYCAIMLGRDCRIVNRESQIGHNWADTKTVRTPYEWNLFVLFKPSKPRVLLNDNHAICWCDFVTYDPSRLYPSRMPMLTNDWETMII